MTLPKFKNKHLQEALFCPEDYYEFRKNNIKIPKKVIINYQDSAIRYFKRKYRGKYTTLNISSHLKIHIFKDIGILKMTGIGAPHAVGYFEELVSMGAKTFINIGTAGGLKKEGVFLCKKSIRDEGTSYHYTKPSKFSYPDKELTRKLEESLSKKGIGYEEGISWTIDAPYRETKAEVMKYSNEGVSTVEMESSALFSVAKVRGVKIASAFVVSDVLGESWEPKFHHINVKKTLNYLLEASIDCLNKMKQS